MKKLTYGCIYEYDWTDMQTFDDCWTTKNNLDETFDERKRTFTNVGYFLKERKGFHLFTEGFSNRGSKDESYFNVTMIPTGQLLNFKKLYLITHREEY